MIYLDYSANTPVDPRVLEVYCRTEQNFIGNPNSTHCAGQAARQEMNRVTGLIAAQLGVLPEEIIYTSGATEANNLALKGTARAARHVGRHIISTPLEHSSVGATLTALQQQGYEVIGVTMKLFGNDDIAVQGESRCCSLDDVEDARSVAFRLRIPYYVFNFSDEFRRQVMDRFADAYGQGQTPNPCIDCNRYLKFERLYERARILGCDAIVTGHYARIEQENGRWLLKKSLDESKDQSYVLYSLTQDQLAHTRLPLGAMHKSETRRIAEEQGFYNANKPDSQDICFVPDGDYAGFIARYTGRDCPAGDFVDESGRVLGRHKGIVHYTVGQRKGLGIAADAPLYVKRIDAAENRVVLSGNDALFSRELMANDFNWIAYDVPPRELRATARVRYHQREQAATVTVLEDGHVHLVFDEPQRAVTPGQAVVLYDGDTVLGGGTIL